MVISVLARIADRNGARRGHLGIDTTVGVVEILQQRARDAQVADAGIGVNIGCGTALDTFDDLELRSFADGQHMAEKDRIHARPASRRHTGCRENAAD